MKIVTRLEFGLQKDEIFSEIEKGAVFVHPTDTIYGIGCDATNSGAVEKIRRIKNRTTQPFSIIAPSKSWIFSHCIVPFDAEEWIEKLPGPYTLVLKLKPNTSKLPYNLTMGLNTIGIRIPDHWFSEAVSDLGIPIVTTSANITGNDFMTSLDNLDPDVRKKMNFIIFEGEKNGRPSTIVKFEEDTTTLTKR